MIHHVKRQRRLRHRRSPNRRVDQLDEKGREARLGALRAWRGHKRRLVNREPHRRTPP
jgi:hypothetical protein